MIEDAVYDYIKQFADIEPDRIYRGYPNRAALPLTNTYIVYVISDNIERVGTNITTYPTNTTISTSSNKHYTVDIDFSSDVRERAMKWASIFETLGRSRFSTEFFSNYDCDFIRSSSIQFLPYVDDTDQYIYRYRVQIIIGEWETVTKEQEYITDLNLRIENVDEHHPPKDVVRLTTFNNQKITIEVGE